MRAEHRDENPPFCSTSWVRFSTSSVSPTPVGSSYMPTGGTYADREPCMQVARALVDLPQEALRGGLAEDIIVNYGCLRIR